MRGLAGNAFTIRRLVAVVAVAVVVAGLAPVGRATAQTPPMVVDERVVTAPDPGAVNFGYSNVPFSNPAPEVALDDTRLAAPAVVDGRPVVYLFDLAADGSWAHSGTVTAPADASSLWGDRLALDGDTIAIADRAAENTPTNFGRVEIHQLVAGTWVETQRIVEPGDFASFADDVELSGDTLVIDGGIVCDANCSDGYWATYERDGSSQFALVRRAGGADELALDADGDLLAVGRVGFFGITTADPYDGHLVVFDTSASPASVVLDETVSADDVGFRDWYRRVAVAPDVLAFEVCCQVRQELHVRPFDGSAFGPLQVLPIAALSDGLAALPGVVLRADIGAGVLRTHILDGSTWGPGPDLALPAGTDPDTPLAATGTRVAVVGDEAVHVLTLGSDRTCLGRAITVDLSAGDTPTAGDDVIAGTDGPDVIDGMDGDDVICGFGGGDWLQGGDGADVVLGGAGPDVVRGGAAGDFVLGEGGDDVVDGQSGADVVVGGPGADWVLGGRGDDVVVGSAGDDLVLGHRGADALFGGAGVDDCRGGRGSDTADGCETVLGVP